MCFAHPVVWSLSQLAVIAEGIPERLTCRLNEVAAKKGVNVIGPATVGGIRPGCFRIGNTGGMIDNIIASKLYRPGSVGYVSRSGGMSNELNNIMARHTDGVCEGVAIGGDRYPGSRFIDHLLRYEANPAIKMLVLLGEVGGIDEYDVCEAMKDGRIKKPLVAWCIGTCAKIFPYEVQFGHAGALANSMAQTADAKNKYVVEMPMELFMEQPIQMPMESPIEFPIEMPICHTSESDIKPRPSMAPSAVSQLSSSPFPIAFV